MTESIEAGRKTDEKIAGGERQERFVKCAERLAAWYQKNKRDLPWRENRDPYRIWISEIMLQQTRVETVIPYYRRFLEKLPTVEALAEVSDDELMKLWEGLGYYSRARHLREAARILVGQYQGVFPEEPSLLMKLPGIGRYTAGAIASIAFGVPAAAVDGNVLRVVSRLTADGRDMQNDGVRREIGDELSDAIAACTTAGEMGAPPGKNLFPGDVNQGFMDLGSAVCPAHAEPHCTRCPLEDLCVAHRDKKELAYPVKKPAKERRKENRTVLLVIDGDRVAVDKRPEKGLLAGLYEYPNYRGYLTEAEALDKVREMGFDPVRIRKLPPSVHIFSHLEWHMTGYKIQISSFDRKKGSGDGVFLVQKSDAEKRYAVPSAFHAYSELLFNKKGKDN
ncbi:MAG: A/G-specific adenine glycosylase [Eubacteriales bacterium]|jgi:A/G-specific adenine glycosylase